MSLSPCKRLLVSAGLAAVFIWPAVSVAAPGDYRFEAVDPYPQRQVGVVLLVRVRDAQGRPQPGGDVLEARLDKSPDGQPGAYAPVTFLRSADYGVYGFKTDLNTDGRYALSFTLRLPTETQPVSGTVVFTTPRPTTAQTPAVP